MARRRFPFWTHDTVAAAVLAGVGMASLQSKLDGLAGELNISVVTAVVHGWPMVALFASLILLIVHSVGQAETLGDEIKDETKHKAAVARTVRPDLDEAVGDGSETVAGFSEVEKPLWCTEAEVR